MKRTSTTLQLLPFKAVNYRLVISCVLLFSLLGYKSYAQVKPAVSSAVAEKTGDLTSVGKDNNPLKKKWSVNPFDHQVFVENVGQYDNVLKTKDHVLFYAMVGGAKLYFTTKGVVYEYDKRVLDKDATEAFEEIREKGGDDDGDSDPDSKIYKIKPHFTSSEWQGANTNVVVQAEDEQNNYYTYGSADNTTIKANLFKKITYKNIYPGIDLEWSFPKNRDQIKYAIIVHPGADISKLKFKYSGNPQTIIDEKGNLVSTGKQFVGHGLTEYAPVSNYQEGGDVKIKYTIENGEEGFASDGSYDNTKTLVIDPAIDPKFTGAYDVPYDMDYDNAGNIYVYGAYNPYQVSMINSSGAVVWTFNPSLIYLNDTYKGTPQKNYFNSEGSYGGFCVDKVGQYAYVSEGFDPFGCAIVQINASGSQSGLFKGTTAMIEMWRMQYNVCSAEILIGGGGVAEPVGQVAQLKGLTTLTSYDVYANTTTNSSKGKDVDRMSIDPTGTPVYMEYGTSTFSLSKHPNANYQNTLLDVTIPMTGTITTEKAAAIVDPTGQSIMELGSTWYIGPGQETSTSGSESSFTCAFNGLASSPNDLYDWDGYTLRQINKGTLATKGTVSVNTTNKNITATFNWDGAGGGTSFDETDVYWSGIAADACDNVYLGSVKKTGNAPQLLVYNSGLVLQSTTALPNYPYSVVLGPNDAVIYVCGGPCAMSPYGSISGTGYVEAYTNSISTVSTSANGVNTTCGLNNGSASASLSLCSTVQNSGVTYSWAPGGQTTQSISGLAAGTYTVTMQVGCGNYYTATATIGGSLPVPPSGVTAGSNGPLCVGATLNLSGGATGATNWSWTGPNGFTSNVQNPSISNVTTADSGVYTLTASNGCGTATPVTVDVKINPNPTVSIAGAPAITICSGQSTHLNVSPIGLPSYTWTPNIPVSLTNTTQDTTTAYPTNTTTYTVIATDANGCSNSAAPATITVNVNPSPTITPTSSIPSDSICSGGSITLGANGGAGYTYSWNTSPTQTTSAITVSPVATTTYIVTATTPAPALCSNGPNAADTIVVTVTPTPTLSVGPSATVSICPGDSAQIYASGASSYSWSNGATKDTIWVKPADTTVYTVNASNGKCPAGASATVTVNVGKLTVAISSSNGSTVCSNVPDTLTAHGGATGYTWSTGATTSSIVITPTVDTMYYVTGSSGLGCTAKDSIKLTVNVTPTIVTVSVNDSTNTVCPGDTTQAFVHDSGVGPFIYTWSTTPVQTHDTAYGLGAGTYTVTVASTNGCSALTTGTVTITTKNITVTATASGGGNVCSGGGSAVITATGANNYIWSTGATTSSITVTPTADSVFEVWGSTTGKCKDSVPVTITVNPTPTMTLNVGRDTGVCSGGSITLSAGGAASYSWNTSPPQTTSSITVSPSSQTTYVVTGTGTGGCTATDTVTVNVVPSPTVNIIPTGGNDTICKNTSVVLTASGSGSNTYVWSTGATGTQITVTPTTSPTSVSIKSTNGGCSVDTSINVYIFPPLNVTMANDSLIGCSGQSVTLGATVSGGDPSGYTYTWTPAIPGGGTGPGPFTVPSNTQTWTCTVTDGCGTSASGTTVVTQAQSPTAHIIPEPADSVLAGGYISFKDSVATNTSTWQWTFGDGGTSGSPFPYYQYNVAGTYTVTLIVTSPVGCRDTVDTVVLVKEWIFVPNVFTPNGDGINDVFHVTAASMKTYNIEIFNRWGEKLFTADNPNIDWNGRSQSGVMESDGTYYYKITATDYAGHNYNLDGYLQLIGGGNVGGGQ